jgi:hypothetical protein
VSVLSPRRCPRCREEYVATAITCVDCGVALVSEGELGEAPVTELPASDALVQVRVENPVWIRALAERLAEEGIPSRVELLDSDSLAARRHGAPCSLWVRPEDAERARQVDAALRRSQLPDLPEDASPEWRDAEGCPACGSALEPEAAECSECGLSFGAPEE